MTAFVTGAAAVYARRRRDEATAARELEAAQADMDRQHRRVLRGEGK